MFTGAILRSAKATTLFEGRVPAVVLDLSKDFRRLTKAHDKSEATGMIREGIQRYYDSLLWSLEKDEWNLKMTESEKREFVDAFYTRLSENTVAPVEAPAGKEFKVKNTIDCDLCNEQVSVSYNACRRSKRNIDAFNTISEENWLDLDEVIDAQGINLLDDLSEGEKREIIDQCWDDAEELIEISMRKQ